MQMGNIVTTSEKVPKNSEGGAWIKDAVDIRPPLTRQVDDFTRYSLANEEVTQPNNVGLQSAVGRGVGAKEQYPHRSVLF